MWCRVYAYHKLTIKLLQLKSVRNCDCVCVRCLKYIIRRYVFIFLASFFMCIFKQFYPRRLTYYFFASSRFVSLAFDYLSCVHIFCSSSLLVFAIHVLKQSMHNLRAMHFSHLELKEKQQKYVKLNVDSRQK